MFLNTQYCKKLTVFVGIAKQQQDLLTRKKYIYFFCNGPSCIFL